MTEITITGYDTYGRPRVSGTHENIDVAEKMAREEAIAYLQKWPDAGPISDWRFLNNPKSLFARAARNRAEELK